MFTPAVLREHVPFLPAITNTDSLLHSRGKLRKRLSPNARGQSKVEETKSTSQMEDDSKKFSLTKDEVALFRHSHKHNVCVDMLRQGYHRSFSEFLALIHRGNTSREATGHGSAVWQQQPLEDQAHKLDQIQFFLTRAEAAQRAGRHEEVYDNRVQLARYFVEPEDKWLCHHFYETSFVSACKVKMDGGRREAEANGSMGHVCTERGQLEAAQEHYEAFHHLTEGQAWKDEAGRPLHAQACQCLWRIYTLLADKTLENKEHEPVIEILTKAYQMAKAGGDKNLEGKAAYRVGLAYQSVGDQATAKRYLRMCVDISTVVGDDESLGKACRAMAKSLESEGSHAECGQYLEKFMEVSQHESLRHNLEEACMCLGLFFCSIGQHDKGCQHFQRAFDTAQELQNLGAMQKAQVYLGTARARMMMPTYSSHVAEGGHADVQKLLAWKESRHDTFSGADKRRL